MEDSISIPRYQKLDLYLERDPVLDITPEKALISDKWRMHRVQFNESVDVFHYTTNCNTDFDNSTIESNGHLSYNHNTHFDTDHQHQQDLLDHSICKTLDGTKFPPFKCYGGLETTDKENEIMNVDSSDHLPPTNDGYIQNNDSCYTKDQSSKKYNYWDYIDYGGNYLVKQAALDTFEDFVGPNFVSGDENNIGCVQGVGMQSRAASKTNESGQHLSKTNIIEEMYSNVSGTSTDSKAFVTPNSTEKRQPNRYLRSNVLKDVNASSFTVKNFTKNSFKDFTNAYKINSNANNNRPKSVENEEIKTRAIRKSDLWEDRSGENLEMVGINKEKYSAGCCYTGMSDGGGEVVGWDEPVLNGTRRLMERLQRIREEAYPGVLVGGEEALRGICQKASLKLNVHGHQFENLISLEVDSRRLLQEVVHKRYNRCRRKQGIKTLHTLSTRA